MKYIRWIAVLLFVALLILFALPKESPAWALQDSDPPPASENCLRCHADTDSVTTFGDGEEKSVHFDLTAFNTSQHGTSNPDANLACYDCHGDYDFPHEAELPATSHDFRIELNTQCERCHVAQTELHEEGVHIGDYDPTTSDINVDEGSYTPLCVDCHGDHEVSEPGAIRAESSVTCGECHSEIFEDYSMSVHGDALISDSNPDVATCVDCHGVHDINDPTTNLARLRSPQLCADCHANEELMEEYEISTNVFDSYLADFHGTTVTIFEHQDPELETNKAVCYDCHGVHDIRSGDDPESSVIQENLLETCQKCHPDATTNFPASWTSHYVPSPENYSLVYYVEKFYGIFIPGIMAMFFIIIIPDAGRRLINLTKKDH